MKEIREGLTQFIGSLLTHSGYEGSAAKQLVCAALLEEALVLVRENNKIDLFAAKPILRATIQILAQRKADYHCLVQESNDSVIKSAVNKMTADLDFIINTLNKLIETAKQKKE